MQQSPEAAAKIRQGYASQCRALAPPTEEPVVEPTEVPQIDAIELENRNGSLPGNGSRFVTILRCGIRVYSNISAEHNLTDVWTKFEPFVEQNILNISTICPEAENETLIETYVQKSNRINLFSY